MEEKDQIKIEEEQVKKAEEALEKSEQESLSSDELKEKYTMDELRKMAESEGFSNPSVLTTKDQVIAVITSLKEAKKAGLPIAKDDAVQDKQDWKSDRARMKAQLASQPKMPIFLPLEGKEKPGIVVVEERPNGEEIIKVAGATVPVTLNGYTTHVPKGRMCQVPKQVYEILMDSLEANRQAGSDLLIDRDESVLKALE